MLHGFNLGILIGIQLYFGGVVCVYNYAGVGSLHKRGPRHDRHARKTRKVAGAHPIDKKTSSVVLRKRGHTRAGHRPRRLHGDTTGTTRPSYANNTHLNVVIICQFQ